MYLGFVVYIGVEVVINAVMARFAKLLNCSGNGTNVVAWYRVQSSVAMKNVLRFQLVHFSYPSINMLCNYM